MSKRIQESRLGRQIKIEQVLKKGKPIADIISTYTSAGEIGNKCVVEVWSHDKNKWGCFRELTHTATTYGGGYDLYVAALAGAIIDGHEISDHSGTQLKTPRCGYFHQKYRVPKGYYMANWNSSAEGWCSCFKRSGTDLFNHLKDYEVRGII